MQNPLTPYAVPSPHATPLSLANSLLQVLKVKEKIQAEKGWEASLQKLIYSGMPARSWKILQDDKTVESYSIEEKGFIVCMVSKPKAVPVASASSSASAPAQVPSTPARPAAAAPAAPPAPAAPAPAAATSTTTVPETPTLAGASGASVSFNDPSALVMGQQGEAAMQNMLEMGYERTEIERAMRAAFFNPDRAVEYLLTGIPEHLQQGQRQAQSPPARPAQQQEPVQASGGDQSADAPPPENINLFEAAAAAASHRGSGGGAARGAAAAGGLGNLDFLRNNPQFQQLREVVQRQPQMLEPILQQVGQGNPQLAQMISQNPDAFLQLLSEDMEEGEGGALPPGIQQVAVTPEERDAIERLCRLGFDRDMVIQAYFACDKNEELAANFLFDQPPDDDME
ncbi:UV excision repair protein rad23, partial [Rhizina undulata]